MLLPKVISNAHHIILLALPSHSQLFYLSIMGQASSKPKQRRSPIDTAKLTGRLMYSGGSLQRVPSAVYLLNNLKAVDLSHNALQNIPSQFGKPTYLHTWHHQYR